MESTSVVEILYNEPTALMINDLCCIAKGRTKFGRSIDWTRGIAMAQWLSTEVTFEL